MDASCKIQRSIHDVRLTYKYVSRILGTYQIALAWILNQDFEVFPLVSAKKASRIASNAKALDIVLAKEEVEWLDLRRDRR